jgi:hypothetical protein
VGSDIHRRDNHPHEWSHKQVQVSSLGTGTATKIYELVQDSLKVNAWYGIKHDSVIVHFVVAETIIIANIYLNMLRLSFNKLMAQKKKEVKFCFNKTVLHSTSVIRHKML